MSEQDYVDTIDNNDNNSNDNHNDDEYEKVCFVCHRPESVAGKMINLPNNMCVCNDCMQKRNRYMVDKADMVIAVWNGSPSGTGKTVAYAKEQGKPVLMIDPESL